MFVVFGSTAMVKIDSTKIVVCQTDGIYKLLWLQTKWWECGLTCQCQLNFRAFVGSRLTPSRPCFKPRLKYIYFEENATILSIVVILWMLKDSALSAIWIQKSDCNRLCIKHRKSALENFDRKLFKIKQFNFSKTPSVGVSVMYIMPLFPVFQELPDFARFFGKTGFRKNYLSLL